MVRKKIRDIRKIIRKILRNLTTTSYVELRSRIPLFTLSYAVLISTNSCKPLSCSSFARKRQRAHTQGKQKQMLHLQHHQQLGFVPAVPACCVWLCAAEGNSQVMMADNQLQAASVEALRCGNEQRGGFVKCPCLLCIAFLLENDAN